MPTAAWHGRWAHTSQSSATGAASSPGRRFVPCCTPWSLRAAQHRRRSSRVLGEVASTRRWLLGNSDNTVEEQKEEGVSGYGEEEDQYLQRQLLLGLGGCPQAGAPLTCYFKHVLVPFGIFQLCQRHSGQRQPPLGELRSSQCLPPLPSGHWPACFWRSLSLWQSPLKPNLWSLQTAGRVSLNV